LKNGHLINEDNEISLLKDGLRKSSIDDVPSELNLQFRDFPATFEYQRVWGA